MRKWHSCANDKTDYFNKINEKFDRSTAYPFPFPSQQSSHYDEPFPLEDLSIGRSPLFPVGYLRFPREASLPWTRWLRTAVLKNRLKSRPRRDGKERRKEKAKKRQTQGLERRGEKKRESACNRRKQRCVRAVTGVWGRKEGRTRWQEEERKAWKKREKKEERRRIDEGGGVERRSEDKERRRKK